MSPYKQTLLYEYYLLKLSQKDQDTISANQKVVDEIQYQLKSVVDLKVSTEPSDYLSKFQDIAKSEKVGGLFTEEQTVLIIRDVIQYMEKK